MYIQVIWWFEATCLNGQQQTFRILTDDTRMAWNKTECQTDRWRTDKKCIGQGNISIKFSIQSHKRRKNRKITKNFFTQTYFYTTEFPSNSISNLETNIGLQGVLRAVGVSILRLSYTMIIIMRDSYHHT